MVRVKCTAMPLTVYLKSNEITFEVKRPQKLPALESREKKGGGAGEGGGSAATENIAGGKCDIYTDYCIFHYEDNHAPHKMI